LPEINALFRKAKSYIRQANVPLPKRLQEYNFIYRLGPSSIFAGDFLAAVDPTVPQALEDRIYEEPEDASVLNRMLYLDWHHTLADNDLRKVSRTCELAGIDVSFPLLDDELVDFSCTIPSSWKMPNNRLRGFFKDTVSGFLPPEIIDKKKHGFGLPFGVWMQEDQGLRELANDSLLGIKKRGFLQASLVDQAVDLHRNAHSAYYGELIWILVALEIWLSSHGHG
jgi:asparagine synthase (glutamine-hydrolysing)